MVDAVISVLLERLLTPLLSEGRRLLELDDQFDKLEDELIYMKNFINEGCKMRRKDQSDNFKKVMSDFRELLYDAEDVIEESRLFFLKLHNGCLSDFMRYCSPQLLKFQYQTAKRLMVINQGIEKVKERMRTYLPTATPSITRKDDGSNQPLRYPIEIDEAMVGLENDSAKVREWISEADHPFLVIGIVGMGGIGKTALARKICYTESVRHLFPYIIFVSVSRSFKLEVLLKEMLTELKVEKEFPRREEVELYLRRLRSKLEDKKYLVVLDDVWGTDEEFWWDSLKQALPEGNGCCIIITTRNEEVVRSMGANDRHIHRPKILSVEDSWSLFAKVAFARNGGRSPNSELEGIAKEIAAKCGGLPLAIKVIGGMMFGKGNSVYEWTRISEHLKGELAEKKKDEPIMSSLELSYEELPSYLKPCFLCLSMFTEDWEVPIDYIIHWWVAEGFISGTNGRTSYEIGKERAIELINRCLLIGVQKDVFEGEFVTVIVHDLVRDMAINIAREENFASLDDMGRQVFSVHSRRLTIFYPMSSKRCMSLFSDGVVNKSAVESKLRTFFLSHIDKEVVQVKELKLRKLKRLRALNLSFMRYLEDQVLLKKFLHGITSLPHLVYLMVSCCALEKIPDSIGNLHNLQILCLHEWKNLKMLPSTVTKLDKLTDFEISECESLECMPDGMGRLSNLERLAGFRPSISNCKDGSRILQLKNLGQLRELHIELINPSQLEEEELNALSDLEHLRSLSIKFGDNDSAIALASKLNHQLSPLRRLEDLWLVNFPKEITPVWLNPTSLPNLQFLAISQGNLTHMGPEFWEREHGVWKIERVFLGDLIELEEEWQRFHGAMPSLTMVRVFHCPKLVSFPLDVTAADAFWWKQEENATGWLYYPSGRAMKNEC